MQAETNITQKKPGRNSAFEILRIIAIIFIIAHHFSVHGGFNFGIYEETSLIVFNSTWINFIAQLGKVGVNLFILISAFYLIDNTRFKTKKFLAILLEMLSISLVIGLVFYFKEKKEFTMPWLKSVLFPFGGSAWWYMTYYLLLYLLSPLLNLGLKAMNKKAHLILAITFTVIWSLIPTLIAKDYGFSNLGWFITLYLIGSYIRLYDVKLKMKPCLGILLSVGIFVSWFMIKFWIGRTYHGNNYYVLRIITWFNLINMNNAVQVLCTILLFLAFKNIEMKSCKPINLIASTTLTIYLIHDSDDLRHYLWIKLFKNATYAASPSLFWYSIGIIMAVFAMGVVLGLIYRYTLGLGFNKLLDVLDKKFLYKIDENFNSKECNN